MRRSCLCPPRPAGAPCPERQCKRHEKPLRAICAIRLQDKNAACERIRGNDLLSIPRSALNTAQGRVEGELGMEYPLTQQPELRKRLIFPPPSVDDNAAN